jgi:hypothetical protein
MKVSISELEGLYSSLPEGKSTTCYHCGHEGELTGPPTSGLCADRKACYARLVEQRIELWREYGEPMDACTICGEYGEVLKNPAGLYAGNGVVQESAAVCVDDRNCNLRQCKVQGHAWSNDQHHCVSQDELGFIGALKNVGKNTWLLWRYCLACGERQDLMTYQEGPIFARRLF